MASSLWVLTGWNGQGTGVGVCVLGHVQLFASPWTVAHQASLSMEFSRQEYWSQFPFPSLGKFLTQGSNQGLLCLLPWQADSFLCSTWEIGQGLCYKGTNSSYEASTLWPHHHPKTLPPKSITLWVRFQCRKLGNTSLPSIATGTLISSFLI